jgi:predicted outer membrane protein
LTWPLLAVIALGAALAAPFALAEDLIDAGRRIYLEGVLPSGKALTGRRFGDTVVAGREAACVNCHRRSGMGSVEGDILIEPITGNYLFMAPDKTMLATMDPRRGKSFNQAHVPYDDKTLARAVRDGATVGGRSMHGMMPRYSLDAASQAALIAYLRQLSVKWSPGVDDDTIRFATIITPGVDAARRQVMIDMLRIAFTQKNASTAGGHQTSGRRHMVSAAEMVLGTPRKWLLDVWELQGAPETWPQQLEEFYRRAPVFAVVSGLAGTTWAPVEQFCESREIPCWFPSIDLPPAGASTYTLHFSRGVLLEADVLAQYLKAMPDKRPARLVQIYRDDPVGHAAAQAIGDRLAGSGIEVVDRPLAAGDANANPITRELTAAKPGDAMMLWLQGEDIAHLAQLPAPGVATYFSAQLAGGEHGMPVAWKPNAHLLYPYELPQKRVMNLNYFHSWLRARHLPLVNELMQSEVYFAVAFLSDTLAEMLDNLYRPYLLERAENMIGKREGSKAEEETRDRQALRRQALQAIKVSQPGTPEPEMLGVRQSTTVFPHLALGPGQRFASKGAYIVRYADAHSDTIVAETGWIVP